MSDVLGIGTMFGSGLSFIGGLIQNQVNHNIARENIAYQREANEANLKYLREANAQNIAFQQSENKITREREDNAVQRAAADMQAAGLSKTLAAGNPASASSLSAPQVQAGSVKALSNQFKYESALQKLNLGQLMLDMAAKKQQLEINDKVANAQIDFYKEQGAHLASVTAGQNISNDNAQRAADDEHAVKQMQILLNDSQVNLNNANKTLREKEGASFEQRLNAELDNILANTNLANANRGKINNEVLEIIKRTEYLGSQIKHMDKQTEMLVEQIISEKINERILIHNLGYAEYSGLPVGVVPSGLVGGTITGSQAIGNMTTSGAVGTGGRYLDYDKFINYVN